MDGLVYDFMDRICLCLGVSSYTVPELVAAECHGLEYAGLVFVGGSVFLLSFSRSHSSLRGCQAHEAFGFDSLRCGPDQLVPVLAGDINRSKLG